MRRDRRIFAGRTRGHIDSPAPASELPREPVQIRGWCLFPCSSVARVELTINGAIHERARLAVERPDLAARSRHPDAPICGFEHTLDLDRLPAEPSSLTIAATAHSLDGRKLALEPVTCALEAGRPRAPIEESEAAELRARSLPRTPRRPPRTGPIRVVVVTHMLVYGGASLYLLELLRRLIEAGGVECEVVSLTDGPLRGELERIGVPVHVTDGFPVTSMARYEGHLAELGAWCAARGFDIALVNALWCFPAIDLAARLGIPSIWALHESFTLPTFWSTAYPPGSLDPYVRERGEQALRTASTVIFQAEATRRLFLPYAPAKRLVTIPYGVELEAIDMAQRSLDRGAVRRELAVDDDAQLMLCLGSVEARKSQAMLAQAFAGLAARHPRAQLALVGANDAAYCAGYRAALREYLARAGLGERVRVKCVTDDPYRWHVAADVLVCASDVESLPRSLAEAMAFGTPVVSTRVFGVPELVDDERSGFLYEVRDLDEMTHALERVLDAGHEELSKIVRAAAARVRERHDPRNYTATIARLIEALVADPNALPGGVLERSRAYA